MIQVYGGGAFPSLGKYRYPRSIQKVWAEVEIPTILRPPSYKPKGVRQPLVESKLLWRELYFR